MSDSDEADIRIWLDLQMVQGRYSSILVDQLVHHRISRTAHVHTVFDELEALERLDSTRATRTKKAEEFRSQLKGLWHKHYSSPAFLLKNILNEWPAKKRLTLAKAINNDALIPDIQKAGRFAHAVAIGGYEARSQSRKITGEWIVFAKLQGANYYLTLGTHNEGDDAILARARACLVEFPELLKESWAA